MKIHEPLVDSTDLELASSASAVYRETIAQLRNEFQEFIAQTRERLQFVCEALQQDSEPNSVESMREGSNRSIPLTLGAIEADSMLNSLPVSEPLAAIEPHSVIEPFAAIESSLPVEPVCRVEPAARNDLSLSAEDPFERINAIKQRLAKQIKSF